jgi:DNA-binding GntR family transcriptional regulator
MPIRVDDPRPPYLQLAAELREAIEGGEYAPGDRLPSTRQLAESYEIAPMTVQHAMKVLRDEGLVVSHQGRGAYVQEPRPTADQPDTPRTLDEALALLAEVQERLDRLEAGAAASPEEGISVDPEPGRAAGLEP